jgi:hypothetical protein
MVVPKFPIGTDEDALERWFEDEARRRGLVQGWHPTRPSPSGRTQAAC